MKKQNRKEKLNHEIKNEKIRLIGDLFNGEIVTLKDALSKANNLELDLVLVSENNEIGVCRILNYEKFIYEQNKKGKPKTLDIKEIKLSYNISQNDIEYRLKNTTEFLSKGHRIKVSMRFKGREMTYVDKGMAVMLNFILNLSDNGVSEAIPKLEGKQIIGYIKPLNKK